MGNELKVRVSLAPWSGRVEFLVRCGKAIAEPLTMKQSEEGATMQPTFGLDKEQAQLLMDDLWRVGLRPTQKGENHV